MASSNYNVFLPGSSDDSELLVNTLSRSVCELPKQYAESLRRGEPLPAEVAQSLVAMEAITADHLTQQEIAFKTFEEEQTNLRDLNVVVPLTAKCNLKCSYCYQVLHGDFQGPSARHIEDWSDNSIVALAEFVRLQLSSEPFQGIKVRWYGGEPLLRLDLISRIGNAIRAAATRALVPMSGDVVTNGVLLTPSTIATLQQFGIDRLEISLDGPREIHDVLRAARNGKSTYDTVFRSILDSAGHFKTIVFRVNVHSQNSTRIVGWLKDIAPTVRAHPNIYLKFKLVEGRTNTLSYEDFCELTLQYTLVARSLKLNILQQRLETETCPAIRQNYYIIQSDLRVFKCPQNLGSDDDVGYVGGDGVFHSNWRFDEWVSFHVKDNSDCSVCAHLPHCNGGCPYNQVMTKINAAALHSYSRKERCCREKLVPLHIVARGL